MEANATRIDGLSKRIAHFRKAYARGLGRKASTLEQAAIDRAARLTALAEAAALDPDSALNDIVRLDGAAQRARRDMEALLVQGKRAPTPANASQRLPSLAELIEGRVHG